MNLITVAKTKSTSAQLKGWQAIAKFLSQPVAVAQRWARESAMPVSRQGRYLVASPEELNNGLDVNPATRFRSLRNPLI